MTETLHLDQALVATAWPMIRVGPPVLDLTVVTPPGGEEEYLWVCKVMPKLCEKVARPPSTAAKVALLYQTCAVGVPFL